MPAKPAKPVLGGRDKVKVAIAQKSPVFMNLDASVERAEGLIVEAGRSGAQLVVFPEAWLAGYPYWTEGWDSVLPQWAGGRIAFRDNALVVPGEHAERIAHAARKAGTYVVLGCNEMDPRPEVSTVYNSLIFFAPDGHVLGRHRKLMPTFTERMFWGQGDADDLAVRDGRRRAPRGRLKASARRQPRGGRRGRCRAVDFAATETSWFRARLRAPRVSSGCRLR